MPQHFVVFFDQRFVDIKVISSVLALTFMLGF
jgi:hypothetical protein